MSVPYCSCPEKFVGQVSYRVKKKRVTDEGRAKESERRPEAGAKLQQGRDGAKDEDARSGSGDGRDPKQGGQGDTFFFLTGGDIVVNRGGMRIKNLE